MRLVSALARAGLQWTPDTRTDFLAQATSREQGIPEARNAASNRATLDTDAVRLQLNHTVDGIGLWNSRHTVFLHEDDQVFDDLLGQIGLGLQNTQSDGLTVGIKTYWEHLGDTRTTGSALRLDERLWILLTCLTMASILMLNVWRLMHRCLPPCLQRVIAC